MTETSITVPPEIKRLFGKPPLIQGEDPELYWESMVLLASALKPKDAVDWLWVKEIVDDSWESMRIRRFKGPVMELERKRALELVLRKILDQTKPTYLEEIKEYASRWFTDSKSREEVTRILAEHGLDIDCIAAQAFALSENTLATMDKMVATGVTRRDAAWRQINLRQQAITRVGEKPLEAGGSETESPPLAPIEAANGSSQ